MSSSQASGEARVVCRQCAAETLDNLGPIPPASVFAGQTLEPPWDGGSLYRCQRCELVFRHPIRPMAEYEQLYEQASASIWVSGGLRADQLLVRGLIESTCPPGGKVLDVGCYDGSLLASLGTGLRRFGIEASAIAADKAAAHGIAIIGRRIQDLAAIEDSFDVICAVDVIEHVGDPRGFVAMLASRLAPGGTLIVSTGSADAAAWRAARGLYWYCSFPEHISFVSPVWARAVASDLSLEFGGAHRFTYGDVEGGSPARLRRRFYRRLLKARLRSWWQARRGRTAPLRSHGEPGLFEDHVLLCFRRADAASRGAASPGSG